MGAALGPPRGPRLLAGGRRPGTQGWGNHRGQPGSLLGLAPEGTSYRPALMRSSRPSSWDCLALASLSWVLLEKGAKSNEYLTRLINQEARIWAEGRTWVGGAGQVRPPSPATELLSCVAAPPSA